jgi:hypothetical protein
MIYTNDMKKIYILPLLLLAFNVSLVDAQVTSEAQTTSTSFNTHISDILYYKNIKKTEFLVQVEDVVNPQNIAYWKVRSYCDDKMTIQLTVSSTNDCGKAVRLDSLSANNTFAFLFDNKTSKLKDFSIKIKAYTKYGKGLHGEKEGFGWK